MLALLLSTVLLWWAVPGVPAPAAAQGHPLPTLVRPLHLQLEGVARVAIADVAKVSEGRIELVTVEALIGEVPARFELKRAPSNPPPLEEGARALLGLRGSRSPFLGGGPPRETVVLTSPEEQRAFADAVADVQRAATPTALANLYVSWIDDGPESLSALALPGLIGGSAVLTPLPQRLLLERARAASDPAREPRARMRSAVLCADSSAATGALLGNLPGDAPTPELLELAFRSGARHHRPELEPALRRTLEHERPELRRSALRSLPRREVSHALADAVSRVAVEDPDSALRAMAERWRTQRAQ